MTPHNGGLWLVPGSNRRLLPHRRVESHMVYQGEPSAPKFIEASKGDVVLFSSLTLHMTAPNTTETTRWAYVIEYMSTNDWDPGLPPPYLVVAKDGKPVSKLVRFYRGRLNPINRLRHWAERAEVGDLLDQNPR